MRPIRSVLTVCVMLKFANAQFDFSHFFSQRHEPPNFAFHGIAQNFYDQQMAPFLFNNYDYLDECKCECDKCYNTRQCCVEFCAKCTQVRSMNGYYYYPYPYVLMPNMQTNSTTTSSTTPTTTTTTIVPTTTTEAPKTIVTTNSEQPEDQAYYDINEEYMQNALRENSLKDVVFNSDPLKKDNSKIILTAMRRTRPRWIPKYGIVPIPDQIAEKLMLRIRQMKVLHPEEDTIRRTDPLRP